MAVTWTWLIAIIVYHLIILLRNESDVEIYFIILIVTKVLLFIIYMNTNSELVDILPLIFIGIKKKLKVKKKVNLTLKYTTYFTYIYYKLWNY